MDEVNRHVREGYLKVGEYDALSSKSMWLDDSVHEEEDSAPGPLGTTGGAYPSRVRRAPASLCRSASGPKGSKGSFVIPTCRVVTSVTRGGGGDDDDAEQGPAERGRGAAGGREGNSSGGRWSRRPAGDTSGQGGEDGERAPLPDFDLVFMSYEILKKDLQPLHRCGRCEKCEKCGGQLNMQ